MLDLTDPRIAQVADAFTAAAAAAAAALGLPQAPAAGVLATETTDALGARARHLDALRTAAVEVDAARGLPLTSPELIAEHLRLAQLALEAITGRYTADDLLGRIFSTFCLGK